MRSRSLVSFSFVAVVFSIVAGCSKKPDAVVLAAPNATAVDPHTPVANIGLSTITAGELDESIKDRLKKDQTEYEKEVYEARREGLEQLILRRLISDEAKKKGVDENAYLHDEIESKVPPASEAEAKAFYDKNPDKMGAQSFDELKGRIVDYLTNQRRSQAAKRYFDDLKAKNSVKIMLTAPEEPRVNVAATGPSKGPANAPVTIVEFSDFQCPFCGRAKGTVDEVMAAYAGKVRLVFRDYPLPFHDKAEKAAEAGACANEQGKFWQMHDYMFTHQETLDVASLKKAARENGIDGTKFDACLDGGKFASQIKANVDAGQAAGVQGTPHFFINGRQLSGAQPIERFKEVIDQELASSK
jgi:protein-disulfide isomerase